jgi:uncharacterized protein (DUF2225 family)
MRKYSKTQVVNHSLIKIEHDMKRNIGAAWIYKLLEKKANSKGFGEKFIRAVSEHDAKYLHPWPSSNPLILLYLYRLSKRQ